MPFCSTRRILVSSSVHADFIQKNRTPVALLKLTDSLRVGAGESTLLMAEQLALQQVLRNGRAIDREV